MGGILGCDPGSEQGKDDEDENQHDTDCRQEIVAGGASERDGCGGQARVSRSLTVTRERELPCVLLHQVSKSPESDYLLSAT